MSITIEAIPHEKNNTFINAQWLFYQNDKNWVAPLKMDRKKLLNVNKNPFYKHSQIQLFIAKSGGKIVGRIAAIINGNHNKEHNDAVGFFGFFECSNNQAVATELLTTAEKWVKERGMNEIRGPVNPSMNDECGLLVDGFDGPPVVLMTYNPEYYIKLIEGAGYSKAKDMHAFLLSQETYRSEKLERLADLIRERNGITFRNIDFKNKEQFTKDVNLIKNMYNEAWQPNWGFVKMNDDEYQFVADDLKQIADPRYVFFAEVKGKPAGFILALPNINQSLIHNRSGNILTGVFHLLTKKKKITLLRIIVLGVLPDFQKLGVDAALYHEIGKRSISNGITHGEASWILEDNDMMVKGLTQVMKGDKYRTYRIYQKKL